MQRILNYWMKRRKNNFKDSIAIIFMFASFYVCNIEIGKSVFPLTV